MSIGESAVVPEIESGPQGRTRRRKHVAKICKIDVCIGDYIKQLQSQTLAELRSKSEGKIDVLTGLPETPRTHTYTLGGEVLSWRPGNRAKRMIVGLGSGRETAEIHYWLTDEQGKRVFEH